METRLGFVFASSSWHSWTPVNGNGAVLLSLW